MKKIQLLVLLGSMAFTTACPKYKPTVDFDNPGSFVGRLNKHIATEQARYYCYRLGQNYTSAGCSGSVINGPDLAKTVRNDLIEDALPFVDNAYMDFITGIQSGRDRGNFIADLVELGTSGAVGITNGERPIQILGVALTAFRGGRRSADLNFYKDQSTPILINKMDGNRAKVRSTILAREKLSIQDYPIGAAIGDIVDYYNAGTLVRAFTELAKDTAVQTKQSEENVLQLKGVPISRPATEKEVVDAKAALAVLRTLSSSLASSESGESAAALQKLQAIVAALEKESDVAPLLKVADISSDETDGTKLLDGLKAVKRKLPNDSPLQGKINQAIVANGR